MTGYYCPVCATPVKAGDICATDIELGTCHAECLEGAPVVDLDTGEPFDGPVATFAYEPHSGAEDGSCLSDPDLGVTSSPAARESDESAAHLSSGGKQ